jgi:LacI family transcriptional regulator
MRVHKTYDRKVLAGVARFVHEVGHWGLYVEDEPWAKVPNLRTWHGHGIIADLDDASVVSAVSGLHIPVVGIGGLANAEERPPGLGYVATDNEKIADVAAEHLLERGFRHFAYCGVPRTPYNPWVEHRRRRFKQRVEEAGYKCSVYIGRQPTARKWEQLQAGLSQWLASLPRPVGLMACNDARARHVLEACRRIGARVPDDIAVIGVDNDEIMCELADPPLSSVIQGAEEIGYRASELLEKMMRGRAPATPWLVVPPVGIATRQSTDILAIEDAVVVEAIRHIRQNIANRVQVSDVARHAGVSRSTLDNRFKAALGRTAHDEIERLRLNTARDLLQQTTIPLKQVAKRAGYNNVQYMTMVFRREIDDTPASVRKKARQ